MQQLPVGSSPPRPYGFSRTPNLHGMVGGGGSWRQDGVVTSSPSVAASPAASQKTGGGAAAPPPPSPNFALTERVEFKLRVAVDTGEGKGNVEMGFRERPSTLPDLLTQLTKSLLWDWIGDGKHTHITISHLLIWSEIEQEWRYLCDPQDLQPNDQIYVFQKYQQRYCEGPLPPPRGYIIAGAEVVNFRSKGVLRIAADLWSKKVNYEFKYENIPTLSDLTIDAERLLTYESILYKEEGIRNNDVVIQKIVFWKDDSWLPLTASSQLKDGLQLYIHQRNVIEVEAAMPHPSIVVPGGKTLTKAWELFHNIDVNRQGWVSEEEVTTVFRSLGLDFPSSSYSEMFSVLDVNKDLRLSFAEFTQIGVLYPSILDYLVLMSGDYKKYWKQRAAFLQQEHKNSKLLKQSRAKTDHLSEVHDELSRLRQQHEEEHRLMLASSGLQYEKGSYRKRQGSV
eukprot:TRINITY_DN34384_c0_g1_i1.p1 TRINITY_DN34384_c0_g1~~TRINITY_DN34384_c0_g1_i1.p1  ORF type:complete len:462 (+),score=72.56 TRINITY_DN34384_c0_g1_i1:31-1386(+)